MIELLGLAFRWLQTFGQVECLAACGRDGALSLTAQPSPADGMSAVDCPVKKNGGRDAASIQV